MRAYTSKNKTEKRVLRMKDLTLFNKTVERVKDELHFLPMHDPRHEQFLRAYEVLSEYSFIQAYNLNERLKNGLRFKNVSHLLDTVKNIPQFL